MHNYHIMVDECLPENCNSFWKELCVVPETMNWEKIHLRKFKCTIDSRLRSFYVKVFHKEIAFNDFCSRSKGETLQIVIFVTKWRRR